MVPTLHVYVVPALSPSHAVPQKRKVCKQCNIVVGPHYYYAKGQADRGNHDGFDTLAFHMLHDPSCVCLMMDTAETIFVQVGLAAALRGGKQQQRQRQQQRQNKKAHQPY